MLDLIDAILFFCEYQLFQTLIFSFHWQEQYYHHLQVADRPSLFTARYTLG